MELSLAQRLRTEILGEQEAAALYRALAAMAPSGEDRRMLLEMAGDEQRHAESFQRLYHSLTGKQYHPATPVPDVSAGYRETLLRRVPDESGDFRKYGNYISTSTTPAMKTAYSRAYLDEGVHAMRILGMLEE